MKITKTQLAKIIKEELNEVTQGEMEFQPLEDARQAYLEEPNDDTRHELGVMVNKLVEPIMAKMGLWWEAEAYYSVGQLVFSNHDDMEVIIDPRGSRGGYDLKISPLPGAEDDFEVIEDTFGSMKGVTQFIYDLENPHDDGMVGEPEAQTELPLEHKVRITKSQLQKIIKEELLKEALPPSSDDLLDGLVSVTQALADIVGDGGGPYDHLIADLEAAEQLIRRAGRYGQKGDHASAVMADYKSDY